MQGNVQPALGEQMQLCTEQWIEFGSIFFHPRSCVAQILRLGSKSIFWRCFQGLCQAEGASSPLAAHHWLAPASASLCCSASDWPLSANGTCSRDFYLLPAYWDRVSVVGSPVGLMSPHLLLLPAQPPCLAVDPWPSCHARPTSACRGTSRETGEKRQRSWLGWQGAAW